MPMRINFFTQPSRLHHDLDHFALVHGPIAFGNFVETDHMKEDTARFDLPLQNVREQLLYVGAAQSKHDYQVDSISQALAYEFSGYTLDNL